MRRSTGARTGRSLDWRRTAVSPDTGHHRRQGRRMRRPCFLRRRLLGGEVADQSFAGRRADAGDPKRGRGGRPPHDGPRRPGPRSRDREVAMHPAIGGVVPLRAQLRRSSSARRPCRGAAPASFSAPRHRGGPRGGRVQRFRDGFTELPAARRIGERYDRDPALGRSLGRGVRARRGVRAAARRARPRLRPGHRSRHGERGDDRRARLPLRAGGGDARSRGAGSGERGGRASRASGSISRATGRRAATPTWIRWWTDGRSRGCARPTLAPFRRAPPPVSAG